MKKSTKQKKETQAKHLNLLTICMVTPTGLEPVLPA